MKKTTKFLLGAGALAGIYTFDLAPGAERKEFSSLEGWRYAHRGLHNISEGIPENTMAAFEAAFSGGFGAELDVHLTRDGRLAVLHDSRLTRLCGVDEFAEEMSYDALRSLGILGTGHSAPLLDDVLTLCAGRSPLIIEIKTHGGNAGALCEKVASALDKYPGPYGIESFDPQAVRWFKINRPNVIRGQLSARFTGDGHPDWLPLYQRLALTHLQTNILTRPDFVAYRFEDSDRLAPRLCAALGAKEVCWTVRSPEDMKKVEARGGLVIFENFLPEGRKEAPRG